MGTRGIWNLRFAGRWYRFQHASGRIPSQEGPWAVRQIKSILASLEDLKDWEMVLFPSPLQPNFDYVYTIDVDAGILIITRREDLNGRSQPVPRKIPLSRLAELDRITTDLLVMAVDEASGLEVEDELAVQEIKYKRFKIHPRPPTALNELQFRVYLDYCFVWRSFIDDPATWRYHSMAFNTLVVGILRIAAWDLEVSRDTQMDFPTELAYFPRWKAPETDIFGFHGYLIILHKSIETDIAISAAISKAQTFLSISPKGITYLILLSFTHVAFVELSCNSVLCTQVLPLITNASAVQCPPGFRLLCHVLTSYCWKPSLAPRERLGVRLPREILNIILRYCTFKSALALSQASFIFEEWYYSENPQFPDLVLQNFKYSVSCCGKKLEIQEDYIYCLNCYTCKHVECAGLEPGLLADRYAICPDCKIGKLCTELDPQGIYEVTRRYPERTCEVSVAGSLKILRRRIGKPSHLRPELRLLGNLANIPPLLIHFTIHFNGMSAGLAYGYDDP